MSRLHIGLRVLSLVYGLSALWCAGWLTQENSKDQSILLPATVLAMMAIPLAVGLFVRRRAAFVAMYVHVSAWLIIGLFTATLIKENGQFLYLAVGHVVVCSLPFLSRRARAPFFATGPLRNAVRHDMRLQSYVDIDGARRVGETENLSEHGAHLAVPVDGLKVGQRIVVQMHLRANKFLRLPAHIVALSGETEEGKKAGLSLQFSHLTDHDKVDLAQFISEGRRQTQMRAPFVLRGTFVWEQREHSCAVHNLTSDGCYLDDKESVLQPGDQVALTIHLYEGDTIEVLAEVLWLPGDATIVAATNIVGSALEFRSLSRRDAARIDERRAQAAVTAKTD